MDEGLVVANVRGHVTTKAKKRTGIAAECSFSTVELKSFSHTIFMWLKMLLVSLLSIGCLSLSLEGRADEAPEPKEKKDEVWVIVEPSKFVPSDVSTEVGLIPYRLRRETWGLLFSGGASSFAPVNYEPNFLQGGFDDVYDSGGFGAIDVQLAIKYNFRFGSLSLDIGGGNYKATSVNPDLDSELSALSLRAGFSYYIDSLFFEPYVVPYGSVGGYVISYKEELLDSGTSVNGFTQIAPYAAAGLQFQVNWIDKRSATDAFAEGGIENTFIFAEARQFFASFAPADPDFETDLFYIAGLRLEF